jgi:hypothetical protein
LSTYVADKALSINESIDMELDDASAPNLKPAKKAGCVFAELDAEFHLILFSLLVLLFILNALFFLIVAMRWLSLPH